MMEKLIDTGDVVIHRPTSEKWVVACVIDDRLSWCGWPEGSARLDDCQLVKKATAEEREALLKEIACMRGDDHRRRYANWRLEEDAKNNA